jgi:hypothetical protein
LIENFLGVARVASSSDVIAAASFENSEIDIISMKQVLEQPNICLQPGKHYTFSSGSFAWHLFAGNYCRMRLIVIFFCCYCLLFIDDLCLVYIMISSLNYPQRCAHLCLEELQVDVRFLNIHFGEHCNVNFYYIVCKKVQR